MSAKNLASHSHLGADIPDVPVPCLLSRESFSEPTTLVAERMSDPTHVDAGPIIAGLPRRGRPAFEPANKEREVVVAMAFTGFSHERIAKNLSISENTLRKHFSHELQCGSDQMLAKIAGTLAAKALAGDTTAAIFILKTRAGWSERPKEIVVATPQPAMPDEEKKQLVARILAMVKPVDSTTDNKSFDAFPNP